jgi:WD40 repeat protein
VPEPPIGLSFDATGARLLVTSGDGEAWLLDGDDGSPRASLRGLPSLRPTGTAARSDFDAAGERVATVDRDGERDVVKVWSTADGTVLRELRGNWRRVASLDFSPRAPRLVVACDDGCARLFDLEKGGEPLRLDCEGANVDCATFDVAGERVATAASDGATRLFDPRTGRLLATLRGHEGVVHSACFSPDGRELVTAGWDGVAIVWDARSGERLAMQQSHHRPILCAEFAPDGATVISAGLDGYVRRWPADPLAFARKLAAESQ